MEIILIIAGILCFLYGILCVLGLTKNDTSKDDAFDKKVMSEKTRRFFGRYYVGAQLLVAGSALVLFGWILYMN